MELSHWNIRKQFTRREAAFLAAGADPYFREFEPAFIAKAQLYEEELGKAFMVSYHRVFGILRYFHALEDIPLRIDREMWISPDEPYLPSIELRESVHRVLSDPANYPMLNFSDDWYEEHFSREDIAFWINAVGLKSVYEFDLSISAKKAADLDEKIATSNVDVQSEKLAVLISAQIKYWGKHSVKTRANHPVNKVVAAYLVKNGFSQSMADAGATIIRPDWAGTGRPPEKD